MKYDFDKIVNRRNTNSLKWDVEENELPMWVADMDFATAPQIKQAIINKAQLGVYGYQIVPDAWYEAYIGWWQRRHGFAIEKDWLCFCTGVIPSVTSMVKRLSNIGDNVVIQTPVFDIFFHSIENTGRHVLENQLVYDGEKYEIDFSNLEEKLAHDNTTLMILCNPHNPVGKIWSKEELEKIGCLCKKYGVKVISDEIHCDITEKGFNYVPFASVNETNKNNSVTCIAASKAFNLAGLQSAAVVIPNRDIRKVVVRGLNSDEVAEPNAFAIEATVAALNEGEEWLEELREYISENRKIAYDFIKKELNGLKVVEQDATYLLWVNCEKVSADAEILCEHIRKATGLYVTAGDQYRGDGAHFIRINVACPKSTLMDGLARFKEGVLSFNK